MVNRGISSVRDPVLWLVVAATTAIRGLLAWRYFGFLGGDDVEVLEEAFRRAVGLAYGPWNVRNLLLPDVLVAPFVRLGSTLGFHETFSLVLCATVPFVVLASVNTVLVYVLALRWLGDRAAARMAMAIYSFHWLPLAFGSTPYPRTAAVTCILLATLSLAGGRRHGARGLAAGCLLALAFAVRASEGMYLLPLLLLVTFGDTDGRRTLQRGLGVLGGFSVGAALTVGLYDLLTWGRPLSSLVGLFKFVVVQRASSSPIAVHPIFFYLTRVLFWLPLTLLPALVLAARVRRARLAWAFLAVPLVVLSFIQFKQLRYLQGTIPFLALLGGAGFAVMRRRWRSWVVTTLFVLTLASEFLGVRVLSRKSMAAVTAVREMASEANVRVVALSQAWAYGDHLYFGNRVAVRDVPTPPSKKDIEKVAVGADRVALYRKDVLRDPALAVALARLGFSPGPAFEWGESKEVVVFSRR
jgi:4-amino-4-deoxy-L-arabinose transferase-like glycosyltransferase